MKKQFFRGSITVISLPNLFKMEVHDKLPCEFGIKCYRKNPRHFELYFHPEEFFVKVKERDPIRGGRKTFVQPSLKTKHSTLQFSEKCDVLFKKSPDAKGAVLPREKRMPESNLLSKNRELCDQKKLDNSKKKRKYSILETKKTLIIKNKKVKTSKLFISYDDNVNCPGCCEENNKNFHSEHICLATQSMSGVFINNELREIKNPLDTVYLKNKTAGEIIKILFLVDMPSDFYSFYEFCKSMIGGLNMKSFQLGELKLVGPFDILSGEMNYLANPELFLCHWRFYYDPPELQTILTTDSGFHIGYWRDDPKENPVFLASNNPNKDCIFKIEGENIFGTVYHYLGEFIKSCDPFEKVKVAKLQSALSNWAEKHNFSLEKKSNKMCLREKRVVSKSFHKAGIVVPVNDKTKIGYRPLNETDANLKKICKLIIKANTENERDSLWENLQPLITAASIANDECDFGNGLELGIDLFCMGSALFHEAIEHLLSTSYLLLNRAEFEKITKTHLKFRRKGNDLSIGN